MSKLAKIKTTETTASVDDFINAIQDEEKRKDSFVLVKLMEKATGAKAKMWGGSIIGFGNKRFVSPNTGREVDWFKIGFAPRKANLTLYLIFDMKQHAAAFEKLGKYKTEGGCIYIKKLSGVDVKILEDLINQAAKGK